jgi:sigma-B regulation protein RsbU (phosphoserine phosphatase)
VIVADVAVVPTWEEHNNIVGQGIRSLMAAPLQTDDRVIGLIYLDSTGASKAFSSADLELLTVMPNVAAIRIECERLVEVEK